MRSFRRKSTDSNLPPEIQAYAQGAHRERMGMAWLVGIVSLVVTLLVVSGLFFGGRWAYHKLAHKDTKSTTAQKDSGTKSDQGKDTTDSNGKTDTHSGDNDKNHTDAPVAAPTPLPAPTAQNPPTTPATGDSSGNTLVRTGPDVDL